MVTDIDEIGFDGSMFLLPLSHNNVLLQISPYVIQRLIQLAHTNGYITVTGTVKIPYHTIKER